MESITSTDWSLNWTTYHISDMTKSEIHIIPDYDLILHEATKKCWCIPIEENGIICHNALDMREFYESKPLDMN